MFSKKSFVKSYRKSTREHPRLELLQKSKTILKMCFLKQDWRQLCNIISKNSFAGLLWLNFQALKQLITTFWDFYNIFFEDQIL